MAWPNLHALAMEVGSITNNSQTSLKATWHLRAKEPPYVTKTLVGVVFYNLPPTKWQHGKGVVIGLKHMHNTASMW